MKLNTSLDHNGETMRGTLPVTLGATIVLLVAAACGGGPAPIPQPDPDSLAAAEQIRRDSTAAVQEERDSVQRVQAEAHERVQREQQAQRDSVVRIQQETAAVAEALSARIHFDFDRSVIKPEWEAVLDMKIAILQANPMLTISIVGHCDERGSDEYNIALGNRRALGAKQYMVNRGIEAQRISTSSMGESQPAMMGSGEEAWSQNRRDEFVIASGGDGLVQPGS